MSTTKQRGWLLGLCCLAVLALCSMGVAAAAVSANTPVGGEIIVPDGAFLAPRRYSVFSDSTGKFNRVVLTNSARTQFVPLQYMGGEGFEATELEFYQINLGSDMTTGMYFLSESVNFSVTSVNSADLTTTLGALSETDVAVTASSDGFLFTLADEDYLRHVVVLVELPWQDIPAGEGMPVCVFAENGVATSFQELGTSGNDRDEIVFPPLEPRDGKDGRWVLSYGDVTEIDGKQMGKGALKYTAVWTKTYTVTFTCHFDYDVQEIADGGNVTIPEFDCAYCMGNSHSSFDYWSINTQPDEEYTEAELLAFPVTSDITVTYRHKVSLNVSYHCADGHESSYIFATDALRGEFCPVPDVTCNNALHEGKVARFIVNDSPMYRLNKEQLAAVVLMEHMRIRLVWIDTPITIRFYCHAVLLSSPDVLSGTLCPVPDQNSCNKPTKHQGYYFDGWFCNTLNKTFTADTLFELVITESLMFTAVWIEKTAAITFFVGDNVYFETTLASGVSLEFPAPPSKLGYTFEHWLDDVGHIVTSLSFNVLELPERYNLHAKFIGKTSTVCFVTNGGEKIDDQLVNNGNTVKLPTVTRRGYTFDGWCSDEALTQSYKADAPVVGDMTLYAKWTIRTFTVTFILNGKASFDLQIAFNTPLSDVLADPRLSDYNLSAVSATDGAEIDFKDGMAVAQDLRLELISKTAVQSLAVGLPLKIVGGVVGVGLLAGLLCLPAVFSKRRKKGVR